MTTTDLFVDPFVTDIRDLRPIKFERGRYDRPIVYPEGAGPATPGKSYYRTTTFIDTVWDKYTLHLWELRMLARGLNMRPDLQLEIAGFPLDDKELTQEQKVRFNEICQEAMVAAGSKTRARIGTQVHNLCELMDYGRELGPVPSNYLTDLSAYSHKTRKFRNLYIEHPVVHDPYQVGGTPDRVVEFEGGKFIADIKTGDNTNVQMGIGKITAQLAMYARSQLYNPNEQHKRTTLHDLSITNGILIHLPATEGRCELHWIDLNEGWNDVQLSRQNRTARKKTWKQLTRPLNI